MVFALLLILLRLLLLSEMEFNGAKVKKEVEKAAEDVKNSVPILQKQI